MADLLHRKDETTRPPAPVRHERRLDRRPQIPRPPAPRISRWIQWMAAFVVLAVAMVLTSVYFIGDGGSTLEVYDPATEHGEFTPMAVRDLTGIDLTVRFAGQDANLDPNVVEPWVEHGAFTPMAVRDLTGIDVTVRFAGQDANLDPDASAVAQAGPDALGRFLTSNPPTGPEPDAVDRYLANN